MQQSKSNIKLSRFSCQLSNLFNSVSADHELLEGFPIKYICRAHRAYTDKSLQMIRTCMHTSQQRSLKIHKSTSFFMFKFYYPPKL